MVPRPDPSTHFPGPCRSFSEDCSSGVTPHGACTSESTPIDPKCYTGLLFSAKTNQVHRQCRATMQAQTSCCRVIGSFVVTWGIPGFFSHCGSQYPGWQERREIAKQSHQMHRSLSTDGNAPPVRKDQMVTALYYKGCSMIRLGVKEEVPVPLIWSQLATQWKMRLP